MNTFQNSTIVIKSEADFDRKVIKSISPSIILFRTTWSGDAFLMSDIFDKIHQEFTNKFQLFAVDVEAIPGLKNRFHIAQIPTVLFFRQGKVVRKLNKVLPSKSIRLHISTFMESVAKGA